MLFLSHVFPYKVFLALLKIYDNGILLEIIPFLPRMIFLFSINGKQ